VKGIKMRKKPLSAFLFAVLAAVFVSCLARGEAASAEKEAVIQITDSFGRAVKLYEYPKRIVSLAPNMTETLFLLGAGNLLAGRTDYCDYPSAAAAVPSVGTITEPNLEHILSLKPDLIVGSTHFLKETLGALENLRVPVYLGIIYSDYEDVFSMIMTLASLVNKTAEAEKVVSGMRTRKAAVEDAVKKAKEKPRVYYLISFGEAGDFTAGKGTFISALIKSAGGINAGDDIEGWRYTVEALFRDEPDIILCGTLSGGVGSGSLEKLSQTPPYNRLAAVKAHRVYEIDNNLLDRIGPRNIEGLEMLAKLFHKDLFP
jgi:iron complex transport system substrate-binding protein